MYRFIIALKLPTWKTTANTGCVVSTSARTVLVANRSVAAAAACATASAALATGGKPERWNGLHVNSEIWDIVAFAVAVMP